MGTDGTIYVHLEGEDVEKRAKHIMTSVWQRRAEVLHGEPAAAAAGGRRSSSGGSRGPPPSRY